MTPERQAELDAAAEYGRQLAIQNDADVARRFERTAAVTGQTAEDVRADFERYFLEREARLSHRRTLRARAHIRLVVSDQG